MVEIKFAIDVKNYPGTVAAVMKETRDYSWFKKLPLNRSLRRNKKLEESLKKYGIIQAVITDEDGYVYAGQHRLDLAKKHNLPVKYVVAINLPADALQELNNTGRNEDLKDSLERYQNKDEYRMFSVLWEAARERFGLSLSAFHGLLKGVEPKASFKDGSLKLTRDEMLQHPEFVEFYADLLSVKNSAYRNVFKHSRVVPALHRLFKQPNYDHKRFIEVLATVGSPEEIATARKGSQVEKSIAAIYNRPLIGRKYTPKSTMIYADRLM